MGIDRATFLIDRDGIDRADLAQGEGGRPCRGGARGGARTALSDAVRRRNRRGCGRSPPHVAATVQPVACAPPAAIFVAGVARRPARRQRDRPDQPALLPGRRRPSARSRRGGSIRTSRRSARISRQLYGLAARAARRGWPIAASIATAAQLRSLRLRRSAADPATRPAQELARDDAPVDARALGAGRSDGARGQRRIDALCRLSDRAEAGGRRRGRGSRAGCRTRRRSSRPTSTTE